MIPVTQTKRGGPDVPADERGDCFDACLASVLEVAIEDVPCPHVDEWWDTAQESVGRHGHRLVYLSDGPLTAAEVGEWLGPVHWIAAVDSLNLGVRDGKPVQHVIVMRGDEVAHDPSLGDCYPAGPLADDVPVHGVVVLLPLAEAVAA